MNKRPTPLVAFDSGIVCVEEQQRDDPALLINPAASQLSLLDAIHARVTRVYCVLDGLAATDNTDTAKANANHGLAAILDEANQLIYALSSKVDDTPRQHTQGDSDEVTRETVESQAPGDVLAATFAAQPEKPTPEMIAASVVEAGIAAQRSTQSEFLDVFGGAQNAPKRPKAPETRIPAHIERAISTYGYANRHSITSPDAVREAYLNLVKAIAGEATVHKHCPKDEKPSKQTADLSDAICILGARIARAQIILTMLTSGRAREALADDEADELDWMMSDILHSIKVAANALVEEVSP